ncbi:hypothetical protein COV93_08350 [Candidatus Woesearchaeota archaeon CG11_big_fil_rev_8_21_14_0_20_43_8]|nr:MAG: hypothetical protein COV93_08350 [Candidatus Woesearchaeota archaeon CG11_big_fil_rev_8_21_14_0_20_43_8]PIO04932.1 MAG: hypothetical protein COT47_06890 [Candidatus Woesearchaeota archaeon CG08_land_8_20_14_0_20_43_7]
MMASFVMMMKKIAVLLLILLFAVSCNAKMAHMKLLAVSEDPDGFKGSLADLYLEIKPGSGRVFIDTFPLTKVDTQISTRFAKEIACDYLDKDCSKMDFIYTIRSGSSIIGGPSAGVGLSVLTISLLSGLPMDETVTMTGTINSGGIVGNVGGVKEKIEAAAAGGITKALIPEGEQMSTLKDNSTLDLVKYGESLGIRVIPISELDDAIYEFTGLITKKNVGDVDIDSDYEDTMKFLAEELCKRSGELRDGLLDYDENSTVETIAESGKNLTVLANQAYLSGKFYSSASFCFGANIRYGQAIFLQKNQTSDEVSAEIAKLHDDIVSFKSTVSRNEIKTITDLEAYMVVHERISDAESYIRILEDNMKKNDTNQSAYLLGYATERLNSAYSWANFLGKPGREFSFDNESLMQSCQIKISEVEERVQYVRLFLPPFFGQADNPLNDAYRELGLKNYALCLFKASKAKAETDVVLSVIGVDPSRIDSLLDKKLSAGKRVMVEQTAQDIFPILGYSYYEYANSLREDDVNSALLYSEYALELSRMDMYFKKKTSIWSYLNVLDTGVFYVFMVGLFLGIGVGFLVMNQINRYVSKKKR